jgi:phosphoglycerate dehydrogenase-like enzyme
MPDAAALDVTDPELLPDDYPLWWCPRLLTTPHVGGFGGRSSRDRLAAAVSETVDR